MNFLSFVSIQGGQVSFDFAWFQNHLSNIVIGTIAALAGVIIVLVGAKFLFDMVADYMGYEQNAKLVDLWSGDRQAMEAKAFLEEDQEEEHRPPLGI